MVANDFIFNNYSMLADFTLRLILAGVLGAFVGFERESRSKEAGLRTHMLVCIGSALIMLVSQYGFFEIIQKYINVDPSRIAAQVVSGIGFLGAGVIFKEHGSIKGLSTAAGLWCVAAIGLAIGSGLYTLGIIATVLILIAFEMLSIFSKKFYNLHIEVQIRTDKNSNINLRNEITNTKNAVTSYRVTNDESSKIINLKIRSKSDEDANKLLESLNSMKDLSIEFYEIN